MQSYREVVERHQDYAYNLSDSPHAEEFRKRVRKDAAEAAKEEFESVLKLVEDADVREKIESAANRVTKAFEALGFAVGYLSEKGYACIY